MAQKSASNVAERPAVSTAASANVKGTHGSGFAAFLVNTLRETSEAATKITEKLKGHIAKMLDFSPDDFVAYYAATKAERESIKAQAKTAKLTVTQLRQSHPKLDYLYVHLSVFDAIARAIETGWKPELDRLTFAAIKAAAKERLDSHAAAAKQADIAKQIAGVQADPKMGEDEKKARLLILKKDMAAAAVVKKSTGQGTATDTKSSFQRELERLDKMDYADLVLVQGWLIKKIAALDAAKPGIKKTTGVDLTQVHDTRKQGAQRAAGTRKRETEHAEASNKRTRKGRK